MATQTVCPRCGARDSFMKGFLPETCVCRICQSQLDWREIPGCGPDCTAATAPDAATVPDASPEAAGMERAREAEAATDVGSADA